VEARDEAWLPPPPSNPRAAAVCRVSTLESAAPDGRSMFLFIREANALFYISPSGHYGGRRCDLEPVRYFRKFHSTHVLKF
jgi:hypothetical protein